MLQLIKRFVREESGLESVEYAIMASLVVAALIGTLTLADDIKDYLNSFGNKMTPIT